MKLIPYHRFQIDTELSFAEVMQRIEQCTGRKKFFNSKPSHEFNGRVLDNEFKITKNISYQNSFLPIVKGKVEKKREGARLTISMRLHLFVMCFMSIWFSGVGIAFTAILIDAKGLSWPLLVPLFMLIFGVGMVSGGFWFEASKQKSRFIELFSKP